MAVVEFALNFETRSGNWRTSHKHRSTRIADFIAGTFCRPGPALAKVAHHLQGRRALKISAIHNQEGFQLLESRFNSFRVLCHRAALPEMLSVQKSQRATAQDLYRNLLANTLLSEEPQSSCAGTTELQSTYIWWSWEPCILLYMHQNVRTMYSKLYK